ncbi:TonB-dependent receptor [Pedomonas mirosovicensis]|uniref:TonB-dependent receptor n=1 Tax=Pedomonas mirosovicensis TaxID=2908641 RepID=UPI002167273A|nr:TonB-dependent receptor [Pedomonas mirosovicensis]MCH8684985.1 TonB-dependent receptor [Pedomonas mirosovicensis]
MNYPSHLILLGLSVSSLSLASAAHAEQGRHDAAATADIIVSAPLRRERLDALQATSVLSADELQRSLQGTIGETLAGLPGVSATSFGPGSSRPVLRGFQGERIRILVDGIGNVDASGSSPDHAVSSDPLTSERVEVVRGPATLLYGSSAVGGVVNQIDRRIPTKAPDAGFEGEAQAIFGTAANEASLGASMTGEIAPSWVAQVSGSFRDTDDMHIGGDAESHYLHEQEEAEGGHDHEGEEAKRGTLENSATRTKTGSVGLTRLFDQGFLGAAISLYDSRYGVPGHEHVGEEEGHDHNHDHDHDHDHDHAEEEEAPVRIDMKQTRVDLKGGYRFDSGFIEEAKLRFGWADYRHFELEGDEIGTRFDVRGYEGRLDLVQRERGAWRGAFGMQGMNRKFKATGDEAYLPANRTQQLGAFALQEGRFGPVTLEGSLRYEINDLEAAGQQGRSFQSVSGSVGGNYRLSDAWRIGVSLSRTTRAPSTEELYANGPHVATRSYLVGDASFGQEKAWGAEGWVRAETDLFSLGASVYWSRFDDYIYEQATGAFIDGLPVYQYTQTDARYTGVELEGSATLAKAAGWTFVADVVGDYTRATNLNTHTPLPRIPAKRVRGGLEAQSEKFDARAEVELTDDQKRVSPNELPTDGYTMVNLSAAWRPWGHDRDITLMLQANNLFDVVARRHASFLKDMAPLSGRDIRLNLHLGF